MADNEKRENLANVRRKLKQFRDQQPNLTQTNSTDGHSPNGASIESNIPYNIIPQFMTAFLNDQQPVLNGFSPTMSKSPVIGLEEINHHLVESPKQSGTRFEDPRRLNSGNSMSARSSQTSVDLEQKLRRDIEHLQEQLEIHVQTIGILVADKSDISAKLSQSLKQLERKQSEMDELYGRLKASRERVQELEKEIQNSTSNVQKREMAAKESDKENDRLKIENIRQSQLIEDLKQTINQSKKQSELDRIKEQQIQELQQTNELKTQQIEELVSSINRIRSDNEQYQQYNTDMQHHIQEMNDQISELNQANTILQREYEILKENKSSDLNQDSLEQENHLLRNAIDQWVNRYEELKLKLEQTTKLLDEKDRSIAELQINFTHSKEILIENFNSNDDQSEKHLMQERFHHVMDENTELKARIEHLEHVILQLQSETETIGDYIRLYQQQREQLHKRYQEKDDYIQQLTQDRLYLQNKFSELEILLQRNSNLTQNQISPSDIIKQSESIDPPMASSTDKTISSTSLPPLSDETKARILILIQELSENHVSSIPNANSSPIKLAFVDQNFHKCSTCSGVVQWV